jgi:hypothetical protein
MPILDQKLKYFCTVCGDEIIAVSASLRSHPKYCNICSRKIKSERDKGLMRQRKGEMPKKKVKTQGKLILVNIEWYNAGLYTGKQGYLRDKFYELFAKLDDFLLVMAEIRKDSKYLAEIKGLDDNKRRAWLIGFFSCINQASNV